MPPNFPISPWLHWASKSVVVLCSPRLGVSFLMAGGQGSCAAGATGTPSGLAMGDVPQILGGVWGRQRGNAVRLLWLCMRELCAGSSALPRSFCTPASAWRALDGSVWGSALPTCLSNSEFWALASARGS